MEYEHWRIQPVTSYNNVNSQWAICVLKEDFHQCAWRLALSTTALEGLLLFLFVCLPGGVVEVF